MRPHCTPVFSSIHRPDAKATSLAGARTGPPPIGIHHWHHANQVDCLATGEVEYVLSNIGEECLLMLSSSRGRSTSLLHNAWKRTWDQPQPRYATFWSEKTPLLLLAQQLLDPKYVKEVRDLANIDLASMYPNVSVVEGTPYVLWKRKGWAHCRWAAVISQP